MPQHLEIEIEGACVAEMMTSHRDGTHYDIYWSSNSGFKFHFPDFDTGIECQPSDPAKRQIDFQNDFTHARRAIAAASETAKQFLHELVKVEKPKANDIEVVQIHLRTNSFDRGRVTIYPQEGETANLRIEIGTGPIRVQDAQPAQIDEFNQVGINIA